MRFLVRWAINALALYAAIYFVNNTIGGIDVQNTSWTAYIWMALIFGLANALLRPLISILTCPLIILTLGLFTLLINTFLFYLVGWIGSFFNAGYTIDNFWSAFVGAIVVSVVSIVLSMILKDDASERRRAERRRENYR